MASDTKVIFEANIPAKMRDGTTLYANVWRPEAPGKYPVLLHRTPYDKSEFRLGILVSPVRAAQEGYVVIFQDCRGRFASEGTFYPFIDEMQDGYDSVEWAADLPYSDGNVGMFGASYGAATQWMAAIAQPPHLKAILPIWMGDGAYEGTLYYGGAFHLGLGLYWAYVIAGGEMVRMLLKGQPIDKVVGPLTMAFDGMPSTYEKLPLAGSQPVLDELGGSYYKDWLKNPEENEYWTRWQYSRFTDKIKTPALSVGGWFDLYSGSVPKLFSQMREGGGSEEARAGQRLVIGPWAHAVMSDAISDIYFGMSSILPGVDLVTLHLKWFDRWLKGQEQPLFAGPPVKIFVMGSNTWRDEQEWPLARTQWTNYYFHSSGKANTAAGDGVLSPVAPDGDELPDTFVYDPNNPVPTTGGCTVLPGGAAAANSGPKEQIHVEAREDVLVYTTPPLEQDVEVTGPITATLFAASSALDTDWTAKLVDVHPNGRSYNLADGIIRARYRKGTTAAELLKPGEVYEYKIDLQTTSNLFKAGHRIRIQVSSSNFPRFDRNPNTGKCVACETELVTAKQAVYHTSNKPSHITLPIIPAK